MGKFELYDRVFIKFQRLTGQIIKIEKSVYNTETYTVRINLDRKILENLNAYQLNHQGVIEKPNCICGGKFTDEPRCAYWCNHNHD